jgi:ArsR family transcriptional regulator
MLATSPRQFRLLANVGMAHSLAVVRRAGASLTSKTMSTQMALAALSALGQPTRLQIFRLLMRSEPKGLSAGMIAEAIGCPHNTFSTHIAILARSGLVTGERDGRTIIYRADLAGMRHLLTYLVMDCCEGHPEMCKLVDVLCGPDCGCAAVGTKKPGKKRR